MKKLSEIAKQWMPLAIAITIVSGTMFGVAQQTLRMSANDPQVQLSEDYTEIIKNESDQPDLSMYSKVDMAKSLSPFVIILDSNGKIVQANGVLDGSTPVPPSGVLESAKKNGRNILTWAPRKDVRLATVVTYVDGKTSGYVISARSLREVEKRIDKVFVLTSIGYAIALLTSLGSVAVPAFMKKK